MSISEIAQTNYQALCANPYPGRGIVVGLDPDGRAMMVTWIMGRGTDSRNRIYSHDDSGRIYTEAANPATMKDPSLIIYNAMNHCDSLFVASNGQQTDTVIKNADVMPLHDILDEAEFVYEPDEPNYTPRITASFYTFDKPALEIEILKKSRWSAACDRHSFLYDELGKGLGLCVTTYMGDGNPLPSFEGEPYLLPLPAGGCEVVANHLWNALNAENRVAIAVKEINLEILDWRVTIINRFSKTEGQTSSS